MGIEGRRGVKKNNFREQDCVSKILMFHPQGKILIKGCHYP